MAASFVFAGIVGEVRPTAARYAAKPANCMPTGKPNGDIAGHSKAKKRTVRPNVAAGCEFLKKPWMIGVQQTYLYCVNLTVKDRLKQNAAAVFVDIPGGLQANFPVEVMACRNQAKKGGDNYETKKDSGSKPSQTY